MAVILVPMLIVSREAAAQESKPRPSLSSNRSQMSRRPPRLSARAMLRLVIWIPNQRNGSGGQGNGGRRTIPSRVRSLSLPANRSRQTCAPNRDAPTPRPVYPRTETTLPPNAGCHEALNRVDVSMAPPHVDPGAPPRYVGELTSARV